ncbi:MAG TPA: Fe-S oxidoreductase, partial [Kutzneria sp.]|nr:Fe-S oxidoreductase [Kutzneria sp.]
MIVRLVLGLLITVVGLALAGRRVLWLANLIRAGQPASGRTDRLGARAAAQLREVFGQRKLLKWSVPGVAHFFTFWGFVILFFTIVEAWGALFDENFAFWWIGRQP